MTSVENRVLHEALPPMNERKDLLQDLSRHLELVYIAKLAYNWPGKPLSM